ncbi:hypothetical protein QYF61_005657 [Mycteria americana]|uniref:Uncharacterized protein n=1 Tax=Mycteria americana TaxID=33587 RepID=A0AAN7PHM6_MYCAM|nr:hypothetical protein QYF61_005657 [Mycteria americana]
MILKVFSNQSDSMIVLDAFFASVFSYQTSGELPDEQRKADVAPILKTALKGDMGKYRLAASLWAFTTLWSDSSWNV